MDDEDGFFGSFGSDTTVADSMGDLGTVSIPTIDETAAQIPVDTADNWMTKLYGSLATAGTAVINGAAQRVTSAGNVIGQRIAQPTPTQEPKKSGFSSPIVLFVVVAIVTVLFVSLLGRRRV